MKRKAKLLPEQRTQLQRILDDKESSAREVRVTQAILLIDQEQKVKFITSMTRLGDCKYLN